MGERFRLDPEALDSANSEFHIVGETLSGAFDTLTGILDDHHGCWGTDDIGKAFAKNYETPSTEVRGYSKDAVTGMGDLYDGVSESSETFQGVDYDNAVKIDDAVDDPK
jgi:hypothetical protein